MLACAFADRLQALIFRVTRGRVGGRFGRGPVLVVRTTGRRSGKIRETTVLYERDGDHYVGDLVQHGQRPSARNVRTGRVTANGLGFGILEAGSGPLALCLHGFPDSAHSWRYLLPELARAGFRGVAPFTRGYAPTTLAADVNQRILAWILS
jgi:hypothetical protein